MHFQFTLAVLRRRGASIKVAPAIIPSGIMKPSSAKCPLMVSKILRLMRFASSKLLNFSSVVVSRANSRLRPKRLSSGTSVRRICCQCPSAGRVECLSARARGTKRKACDTCQFFFSCINGRSHADQAGPELRR